MVVLRSAAVPWASADLSTRVLLCLEVREGDSAPEQPRHRRRRSLSVCPGSQQKTKARQVCVVLPVGDSVMVTVLGRVLL